MTYQFSRTETLKYSKLSSLNLNYINRIGLVKPFEVRKGKHYYRWQDILELRVISKLKEYVHLSKIRQAKESLGKISFTTDNLADKSLAIFCGEIILIDKQNDITCFLSGKTATAQLLGIFDCNDILLELRKAIPREHRETLSKVA